MPSGKVRFSPERTIDSKPTHPTTPPVDSVPSTVPLFMQYFTSAVSAFSSPISLGNGISVLFKSLIAVFSSSVSAALAVVNNISFSIPTTDGSTS